MASSVRFEYSPVALRRSRFLLSRIVMLYSSP